MVVVVVITCLCLHYPTKALPGIFSGCLSMRSFVHSFAGQILLPRYLMNGFNNVNEYSTAHPDDLVRFWRSKFEVTADLPHVDAGEMKSIFWFTVVSTCHILSTS